MTIGSFGRLACAALVLLAGAALPARAHHSVAAFDLSEKSRKTVSGIVRKFEWQNPHSWIFFDVAVADGSKTSWGAEMSSPGALRRAGFAWNSVKVGEQVTIELAPARDGKPAGLLTRITWADGRTWQPTGSASPLPPAGQQAPGQRGGETVSNAPTLDNSPPQVQRSPQ